MTSKRSLTFLLLVGLICCFALPVQMQAEAQAKSQSKKDVQYISSDELVKLLGTPTVVIVDVRTPESWEESNLQIPGAIRRNPDNIKKWGNSLPPGSLIVTYCA